MSLMLISNPSYVVLEIPEPISTSITKIREKYEPQIAHFPVEITVAGSSGVGPISSGQELDFVISELEIILVSFQSFEISFLTIERFPETDIFYLVPNDKSPFKKLHDLIKSTNIKFETNPHPYDPHCSLRGFTPLPKGLEDEINRIIFPKEKFKISKIAIFEVDGMKTNKLWGKGL